MNLSVIQATEANLTALLCSRQMDSTARPFHIVRAARDTLRAEIAITSESNTLEALRHAESFAYAISCGLPVPDAKAQLALIRAAIAKATT